MKKSGKNDRAGQAAGGLSGESGATPTVDGRMLFFNAANRPLMEVGDDQTVEVELVDWVNNAVTEDPSTHALVCAPHRCPLTGPIALKGARPGEGLRVDIRAVRLADRGIACLRPGVGLLGDRVAGTRVSFFDFADGTAPLAGGVRVALAPMVGCIGVTPAGNPVPTGKAGDHGGNLDVREVGPGTSIYFRVQVPGGLVALGDCHALMGDGEVSGSGIEVGGWVTLSLRRLETPISARPVVETKDAWITVAAHAVSDMVSLLQCRLGLGFEDAYQTAGLAGHLGIGQAVAGLTAKFTVPKYALGKRI